jgi:hypothetical protein
MLRISTSACRNGKDPLREKLLSNAPPDRQFSATQALQEEVISAERAAAMEREAAVERERKREPLREGLTIITRA